MNENTQRLLALWDHFGGDAALEMLHVAELAGLDVSGPAKLTVEFQDGGVFFIGIDDRQRTEAAA